MMLGKVVVEEYVPSRNIQAEKLVEVRGTSRQPKLHDVSFELRKGEILGFYGLVGAGKTEVARVLYGLDPYKGEILLQRRCQRRSPASRSALKAGLTLIPEERRAGRHLRAAVHPGEHPDDAHGKGILRNGFINRAQGEPAWPTVHQEHVGGHRSREQKVAQLLSGGNQQKVVISKCLNRESDVLLMDEPTRGVDVGRQAGDPRHHPRRWPAQGKGIIVFSSELPEIVHLCDRIVLMSEGKVLAVLDNGPGHRQRHIMALVAGGRGSAHDAGNEPFAENREGPEVLLLLILRGAQPCSLRLPWRHSLENIFNMLKQSAMVIMVASRGHPPHDDGQLRPVHRQHPGAARACSTRSWPTHGVHGRCGRGGHRWWAVLQSAWSTAPWWPRVGNSRPSSPPWA